MTTLSKEEKSKIIAEYGANEKDSGNSEAQVALITKRIKDVTEHMKQHRKDFHTRRGLTTLVAKRRRLLNYIMKRDINKYRALIQKLGLRR